MGLINFLKHLSAQVKCEQTQTEKNNWVFVGNKMQHLHMNKNIIVEKNQLCVFRAKNKICDVLKTGDYKVCEEDLPFLFNKNNIHKKQQKINIKYQKKGKKKLKKLRVNCDIYFVKENNISFVIPLKRTQKFNNTKYIEKITAYIKFNILDVKNLSKFLFLEIATVSTQKFRSLLQKEFFKFLDNELDKFQGEIADLEDEDTSKAIRYKFTHEFALLGLDILEINFKDYVDATKYKNKANNKNINIQNQTEQTKLMQKEDNIFTEENNQNYIEKNVSTEDNNSTIDVNLMLEENNTEQTHIVNTEIQNSEEKTTNINQSYKTVLESGKITINPNEEI